MTIVAGFCVRDGIVLCGDTMYRGAMKLHQSKLFGSTISDSPHAAEHLSMVFAAAGHEANANMAIEDCIGGVRDSCRTTHSQENHESPASRDSRNKSNVRRRQN